MSRLSNQDIERYYFEMFRKDYQLPPGTITYKDAPDVILEGLKRIGIEITNLFLDEGSLSEERTIPKEITRKSCLQRPAEIRR